MNTCTDPDCACENAPKRSSEGPTTAWPIRVEEFVNGHWVPMLEGESPAFSDSDEESLQRR